MLLIKLSYLQQAIEVQQGEGGLSKKKLTDNARPVSFRTLPMMRLKNEAAPLAKSAKASIPKNEASLIIEKEAEAPPVKKEIPVTAAPPAPAAPLASLKKLREKIALQNNVGGAESIPLTLEKIQEAWNEYIEILKTNKNHSSVTIFGMATLTVLDDDRFEITVENAMQYKFVEVERSGLIEHFTKKFRNRSLTYQLLVNKNAVKEEEVPVASLTSKQKFQLMSDQYPNVKLLKEKLKLDIG